MTSPFSDDELEQLRELAEKARALCVGARDWYAADVVAESRYVNDTDAAFIAALNPSTVLRLLASVEKANAERDDAERQVSGWAAVVRMQRDENAELREALEPFVDERHIPRSHRRGGTVCNFCGFRWPCDNEDARRALAPKGETESHEDREPQPSDGPDYHTDHAFWRMRQGETEREGNE